MSSTKRVALAPFDSTIHIVVTTDPNYYVDSNGLTIWVKETPDEDITRHTDALCFGADKMNVYILLSPDIGPGTIAHECLHAIAHIFNWIGAKASYDDTEVFAYHVGWLTDIACKHHSKTVESYGKRK